MLHADWSINTDRNMTRVPRWPDVIRRMIFCFVFKYDFDTERMSVFSHFSEH